MTRHLCMQRALRPNELSRGQTMTNARFIKSVTDAAQQDVPQMPWARGKRRAMFISRRKAALDLRKSA